jgi:hypothetical protein
MNISIPFSPKDVNELGTLCEKYGSDKGHGSEPFKSAHNYTSFYHALFAPIRDKKINIFEMGLGTNNINIASNMGAHGKPGASLRVWRDYFPNAQIYGADIDKDILFYDYHIATYYCDQTSSEALKELSKDLPDQLDIIIDDGLHTFHANTIMLHTMIHKLSVGGVYIIEDIYKNNVPRMTEYIQNTLKKVYPHCTFTLLQLPHETNKDDNNLVVIQRNF